MNNKYTVYYFVSSTKICNSYVNIYYISPIPKHVKHPKNPLNVPTQGLIYQPTTSKYYLWVTVQEQARVAELEEQLSAYTQQAGAPDVQSKLSETEVLLEQGQLKLAETEILLEQEKEKSTEVESLLEQEKEKSIEVESLLEQEKEKSTEVESLLEQEKEKSTEVESLLEQEKEKSTEVESLLEQEKKAVVEVEDKLESEKRWHSETLVKLNEVRFVQFWLAGCNNSSSNNKSCQA